MEDDGWELPEIGCPDLRVHPMYLVDADDLALLDLWHAYRGRDGGTFATMGGVLRLPPTPGHLPFDGGVADQPACVWAAFRIMEAAHAALTRNRGGNDGGED